MSQLTIQMIPNINNENFTFNANYPARSANPNYVHEGDSFSKKKATTTKKLLNKAYFILIFHWLVRQWSSWPVRANEKCPENNWKSTWTKQPETAFCMCHSFDPFNHELSCNSLNSPWHQTKVSVFYIHTYIRTYSKTLRIRSYIFWSFAK